MDTNWAAEHLQTIRTLMERSALYRRALAPISTFVGVVGIVAGIAGWSLKLESPRKFSIYWMSIGVVALGGALLLVRRQAVKQGESFWSPPTRRVAQAMAPALFIGLLLGFVVTLGYKDHSPGDIFLSFLILIPWTILYGLALHSAGFFMPRGIRLFGWGFVLVGLALPAVILWFGGFSGPGVLDFWSDKSPSLVMGFIFGGLHLTYGVYLYFTEQRKNEA